LKKRLNIEDYVHKTSTVEATGGGTVSFPVFDFRSMFVSLIDDPRMKDHLLVNWEEPSSPPPFDGGSLDEIHSGMWHQRTSEKLIKNNSNEILCGIILFIDRTHVADKDKLSLEPVLFSLSIIPRALRNHPFAWRPLGFIPKFSASKSLGSNAQTYHRVLGTILSGLVRAQNNGGIKCCVLADQLDADGAETDFCFKVPLAFVIGDVEGHDVLCARYHTHNTKMLSRECNCSMEDADNHQVEPNPHGTSLLLSKGARELDAHLNHVFQFEWVDSFVDPAFVVDNIGCPCQTLLVLTPRSEWAKLFL
jgi:hypothetical protein